MIQAVFGRTTMFFLHMQVTKNLSSNGATASEWWSEGDLNRYSASPLQDELAMAGWRSKNFAEDGLFMLLGPKSFLCVAAPKC